MFDENGTLTFDSNSRFMQVVNAFTLPASGMKVEPWPDASRQFAVGIGVYPKCWRGALSNGLPWGIVMSYCVRVGPTSGGGGHAAILSRPMGGGGDPTPPDTPQAAPPTAMIVDVTGL
ncbi:hypothetical protein D9M71_721560 [compost metagenome]